MLTAGVDNLVGTANNDTFNATETAASSVLGGLDKVDGGLGVDTLNIADTATAAAADFALPAGLTVTNVEKMAITTNGAIGTSGGTAFDVSGFAGLTEFTGVAAGAGTAGGSNVKAAGTTDVNLTVAGNNQVDIAGGKAVSVVSGAAGTGTVGVVGKDLTSVSIKGGGVATVDNLGGAAGTTTAIGTTLKSVTLDAIAGATAAVKGAAVDTLTVQNQATALATTVTNGTSKELTVNVDNAGYTSAGAAVAGVSVAAGSAATTINLNATGSKSNVSVSGAAAKTLNITGSADLTLAAPLATATKIDGSAATGALALGTLAAGTVNVSTGAGNDSLTLSATAKATVATGAGNDAVTLASAVAAGSSVNLGAGDDKLLVNGGAVAVDTAANVTVIDGGEGTDSLSASLINAGNADQIINFEELDLSAATTTPLDVELVTGSAITGLTLSGGTGGAAVTNVAAGVGLEVSGSNTGTTTIGVKGAAAGTADSFAITFDGAAVAAAPVAANVAAGTVVVDGVETVSVASTGAANTWNSLNLQDDKLQTVNITGDKNLDLTFAAGTGTNTGTGLGGGVKMIDGSAATGKLNISTANITADDKAGVGLTVKGGAANDTITLAQKATVDAGAGNDVITTSADGGTLTGGAGEDTFDVSAAVATATTEAGSVLTTINDFMAGDKIDFNGGTVFNATKVAFGAGVTNLDLALDAIGTQAASAASWGQYGNNTYIVHDTDGTGGFSVGDTVVKLAGLVDLSDDTYSASVLTGV